jgi:hypothetical protein
MKKHFLCFKTDINTGLKISRIDVVGIRDIGGDLSGEIQTIAVEVKKKSPFATACGQTLGYKIYAHRVYLAELRSRPFTWEEIDIACHLGIGLIQIRDGECKEAISSPLYEPMRGLNLLVLDQLGYNRCQFCGYFFETGGRKQGYSKVRAGDDNVQRAIQEEKGVIFWNYEVAERKHKLGLRVAADTTYERRFVCPECVQKLLAIQDKRIRGWFSEYAAESVGKLLADQEKKIKTWVSKQRANR